MKNSLEALAGLLLLNSLAPALGAQMQATSPGHETLARIARPTAPAEQLWYGSNLGSVDLLDMFTMPQAWPAARSKIDVWLFSNSQVGSGGWSCTVLPHAECGPNHLANLANVQAFQQLGSWGIDIAIESFYSGPIDTLNPVTCKTPAQVLSLTLNGSLDAIAGVHNNGGVVKYLRIDEPLWRWYPTDYYLQTQQTDPRDCLVQTLDEVADHVAPYIQQMNAWYPDITIGQVELYPEVSARTLKDWVLTLEAHGVTLPFLHIDVNHPRVLQYQGFGLNVDLAADMRELRAFAETRGMAFGIIYTDVNWNSRLWNPGEYTDSTYYDGTLSWINQIEAAGARPHHRIYQSWVQPYLTTGNGPRQAPINLPEDDPAIFSHTRLLNDTY